MQEGKFEGPASAKAAVQASGPLAQPIVISRHSKLTPKRPVKFEVVDQAPSAKSERWERVVAIICSGKKWQFDNFPFAVRLLPALLAITGTALAFPLVQFLASLPLLP